MSTSTTPLSTAIAALPDPPHVPPSRPVWPAMGRDGVARADNGVRFVIVSEYQIIRGVLDEGRVVLRHFDGEVMEASEEELSGWLRAFWQLKREGKLSEALDAFWKERF